MDDSILSFERVTHVEVRCACGLALVFPLSPQTEQPRPIRPNRCPNCDSDLGTAAVGVQALRQFCFHARAFTAAMQNSGVEIRIAAQE